MHSEGNVIKRLIIFMMYVLIRPTDFHFHFQSVLKNILKDSKTKGEKGQRTNMFYSAYAKFH